VLMVLEEGFAWNGRSCGSLSEVAVKITGSRCRDLASSDCGSAAHEGWRLVKTACDDGGLSGGTMERPPLQRLLAEVAASRINVIVVCKVDRLTRSLADFVGIVETLDRHGASWHFHGVGEVAVSRAVRSPMG
jgi:Resolvase, N terminal domain